MQNNVYLLNIGWPPGWGRILVAIPTILTPVESDSVNFENYRSVGPVAIDAMYSPRNAGELKIWTKIKNRKSGSVQRGRGIEIER